MASITFTYMMKCVVLIQVCMASAELSHTFYGTSCPEALRIVETGIINAVVKDARMGASLLHMHFHDCFVNGCDASVLLEDTPSFRGEQSAGANINSLRGFEVIDLIKSQLEAACPGVVSCADILSVAARDSVVALGGPSWTVQLGRRDSTTASFGATKDLPGPGSNIERLKQAFSHKDLSVKDMVALSGAHTIGQVKCSNFRKRLYNEINVDPTLSVWLKSNCPKSGGDGNLSPLDPRTPHQFDNSYFINLESGKGILHSDQVLYSGFTRSHVKAYSSNLTAFFQDFAAAMVKMGNLSPLTGSRGQIRTNCRRIN